MTSRPSFLSIAACLLLLGASAQAQAAEPARLAAAPVAPKAAEPRAAAPAARAAVRQVAATGTSARPGTTTVVQAAGSVIVLADGIVANAAVAQIQPPAEGFVYER